MNAFNPLRYRPAQIAKALIAGLSCTIGLLALAAATFGDGALSTIGQWATAAALFLTPILVFLKKAQPWVDMLDNAIAQPPGSGRE